MKTMKPIGEILHETQGKKSSALPNGPGEVRNDVIYGQLLILLF